MLKDFSDSEDDAHLLRQQNQWRFSGSLDRVWALWIVLKLDPFFFFPSLDVSFVWREQWLPRCKSGGDREPGKPNKGG